MTRNRSIELFLHEQKPMRKTLATCLKRNFHWKCLTLTVIITTCLSTIFWCQLNHYSYFDLRAIKIRHRFPEFSKGPCEQGYNFIPVAFSVMLYLVYIMECWHYKNTLDAIPKIDNEALKGYLAHMKLATPIIWWRALCYHYLRKSRQIAGQRSSAMTNQIYLERVNSHSSGAVFLFEEMGVKDISKKIVDLEKHHVIRFKIAKGFVFANHQSANEFEDQRARFFQENEQRDDYMEVKEGMELTNLDFKSHLVAYGKSRSVKNPPWFLNPCWFWMCSLCLFSWLLRLFIEYCTSNVNYHVTKLFGTNYLSPNNPHYTGPLTRASTLDSCQLEEILAGSADYLMVPSYSEALLMGDDPYAVSTTNLNRSYRQDREGNLHICTRASQDTLNNERVLTNQGAFDGRTRLPFPLSRSMSLRRLTSALWPPSSRRIGPCKARANYRSTSYTGLSHIGNPHRPSAPYYAALPESPLSKDGATVAAPLSIDDAFCDGHGRLHQRQSFDDEVEIDAVNGEPSLYWQQNGRRQSIPGDVVRGYSREQSQQHTVRPIDAVDDVNDEDASVVSPPPTYDAALKMRRWSASAARKIRRSATIPDGWLKWLSTLTTTLGVGSSGGGSRVTPAVGASTAAVNVRLGQMTERAAGDIERLETLL